MTWNNTKALICIVTAVTSLLASIASADEGNRSIVNCSTGSDGSVHCDFVLSDTHDAVEDGEDEEELATEWADEIHGETALESIEELEAEVADEEE